MTRKLREVLNVRLDEPLARELARIAATERRSESEVARTLLGYGIEVVRRLQATEFQRPFEWREPEEEHPWPTVLEIEARWRPMTDDEITANELWSYVGTPVEYEDAP